MNLSDEGGFDSQKLILSQILLASKILLDSNLTVLLQAWQPFETISMVSVFQGNCYDTLQAKRVQ